MQSERLLSEIKEIRKKYSRAIFELGKANDTMAKLELEKGDLSEKYNKSEEINLKLQEEKEVISKQLEEALEKINLLSIENSNLNLKQTSSNQNPTEHREVSKLKQQNCSLQARLKQTERGIEIHERFKKEINCEEKEENDFEVEKLSNHEKRKRKYFYLVRWKGFGPDGDTWEPEKILVAHDCYKIIKNIINCNAREKKT